MKKDYPFVMATILKVLYEKGDLSELVFPKKIIDEALRRLEERGLVEKVYVLTEKGEKLVEEEIKKTKG